jgi:hypothetical protein
MTKQHIIQLVQDSEADASLKKMVIGYIELSYKAGYDEGFAFGMRRGSEISSSIFTQLFQPKGRP